MRAIPVMTAAICLGLGSAGMLSAGPDRVGLPQSYPSDFVNYLDVDRPDRKRVRKMYVNPAARDAAKAGAGLPDGTILIMEDHDAEVDADGNPVHDGDGRLIALQPVLNIFVMEKNGAWQTDNGNWDYAWYLPDGSPKADAEFAGCFSCHANRSERDFNFTFSTFVSDPTK